MNLPFKKAKPIWIQTKPQEYNLNVGFQAVLSGMPPSQKITLQVTAVSFYRVHFGGNFVGYGPARAAHGHARIDEWDLTPFLENKDQVLAIEVYAPQVNSYYSTDESGFLLAEVISGSKVLCYTGLNEGGFQALRIRDRIQRVHRYSFQRAFCESYSLKPASRDWMINPQSRDSKAEIVAQKPRKLLPRSIAYPDFSIIHPSEEIASGKVQINRKRKEPAKDRYIVNIGPKFKGYLDQTIKVRPALDWENLVMVPQSETKIPFNVSDSISLKKNYRLYKFERNSTGFLKLRIQCRQKSSLRLAFDEILEKGSLRIQRNSTLNLISLELSPGEYEFESIEPYTLQYLSVAVLEGEVTIQGLGIREYAYPVPFPSFVQKRKKSPIQVIYQAALETYRQNTVDLMMDCPSRERAGWLCDSYFTAQVEYRLFRKNIQERHFLENYLHAPQLPHLPKGMVPMCYPADHNDGNFIPQWALWLVVELLEYQKRTKDKALIRAFESKIARLLRYFKSYENKEGLLENLPGWNFVEWSKANELVAGVNYPTNMLYCAALEAAAQLWKKPELYKKASTLKSVIIKKSFTDGYFHDQAIRNPEGGLILQPSTTEVCQYYAFFFKITTPQEQPLLWKTLVKKCPITRDSTQVLPTLFPANSLMGYYMRISLLSDHGYRKELRKDLLDYFFPMAQKTGTLWEGKESNASLNHGFASFVIEPILEHFADEIFDAKS